MNCVPLPLTSLLAANEKFKYIRRINPISDELWSVLSFGIIEALRIPSNEASKRLLVGNIFKLIETSYIAKDLKLYREVIELITQPIGDQTQKYLEATPTLLQMFKTCMIHLVIFNLKEKLWLMDKFHTNLPLSCNERTIFQHLCSKFKLEICIYFLISENEYERINYLSQARGAVIDIFMHQQQSGVNVGLLLRDEHMKYYTTDTKVDLNTFPFICCSANQKMMRHSLIAGFKFEPRYSCPVELRADVEIYQGPSSSQSSTKSSRDGEVKTKAKFIKPSS